jgi:hypothetical protein
VAVALLLAAFTTGARAEGVRLQAAGSPLALRSPWVEAEGASAALAREAASARRAGPAALTAERARVLLRSLTVPGWGQASLGHRGAAKLFVLAELGIWTSYTSFRVQESLRLHASEQTARLFAGIDLSGRNEEFHRIVGAFPNSDLYNILVVRREAANLYYGDPAAYNEYVAKHQIAGADNWAWASPESFERYRRERRDAQRASLRANTALALAVANRMVSALHAARAAGRAARPEAARWQLEAMPSAFDPTLVHFGVRARF